MAEQLQDVMTIGFQGIMGHIDLVKFVHFVVNYRQLKVPENVKKADMFVGRPDIEAPVSEDEGRTLNLPIGPELPKVFACINETGGWTFMLADEY